MLLNKYIVYRGLMNVSIGRFDKVLYRTEMIAVQTCSLTFYIIVEFPYYYIQEQQKKHNKTQT